MIFLRSLAAFVIIALVVASCSNPERVRVASAPLPPLPRAKPADLPGGGGVMLSSAPTSEVEVATLGETASAPRALGEEVAEPTLPASSAPAPEEGHILRPPESSYVVQLGDTLFSISQRLEVPLAAMIDANPTNPDTVTTASQLANSGISSATSKPA